MFACLVWILAFAHLSGLTAPFDCSKQKAGRLGQRASMLGGNYTQMFLCVKPHLVLLKCCKKDCTLSFPEKVAAVLQPDHYSFYNVGCFSKAQHRHEHSGVLCQLPFGWLAALSGISGKRDLREFEPVWVEEGGRHGLDSGPVLPHPPPFVQLQTLSSFHPWSARLGAPGTLETHAPQSHHIHPHKSSLSLHSFLCSFLLLLWPLQCYEFSPCVPFLSYICSSANPLSPPFAFFPKLLHPRVLIFAPQSQESVESQRKNCFTSC